MVHVLAAVGIADAASKIASSAASVWKHVASGAHAGAKTAQQPGSFEALLSGHGIDPIASGRDFASTVLAGMPGRSSNALPVTSRAPASGTGAIDRVV